MLFEWQFGVRLLRGCPIYEKEDCECINDDTALLKYALALIKELTEENERLRAENKKAKTSVDIFRELADKHALQYELREDKVKRLERFKTYFDDLFETGLQVSNWYENGELKPFDEFYISALDCMRE